MNKHVPETTDVQDITNPVQNTIDRIPTNPKLKTVRTADGPFGWFAHGVTGDELNRLVSDIQKHLIQSHDNNIELQEKYEQLLWDLNEFDKNYLEGNTKAIKASEQAAIEAKTLKQKLKIAYSIAGVSMIVAITALIMHFI